MSRRREIATGNSPVARFYDDSTMMHRHEPMENFIMGGYPYLGPFGHSLFGLDFYRRLGAHMCDDFSSDDDDYYEPRKATNNNWHLRPHPRIRQLTEEEADKHARELIEEEEREKKKTERKKQKKLRKKERKRLEKEKALKDVTPKEEPLDNEEDNPVIESDDEENKSNEAAGCGDDDGGGTFTLAESDLNNSFAYNPEPEEPPTRRPAAELGEKKTKLIQQPKEEEVKTVQKIDAGTKEETQENVKEKTPEECVNRSKELAGYGNNMAALGQYQAAVVFFTDAIKYNPTELKLFGNRSLCYERMQQYDKALQDAEIALSMEPDWVKGLFRKGKALCGLKRYYDASLVYNKVLKLEPSNLEVAEQLKRTQTLHLMEMGFSQEQSGAALAAHRTLEGALDALFGGEGLPAAGGEVTEQPTAPDEEEEENEEKVDDDEGWEVQTGRNSRAQQVKEAERQSRANSQSPTPASRNSGKPPLYSVWVGTLSPTITYANLYDLFSRVGKVSGVKMLLDQQSAFVNYVKREDCDKAVECFDGMVLEGAPLSVQLAIRLQSGLGGFEPSSYKRECFFWRTSGCTRQDCTFRHVPENKHVDRGRFNSRLGVHQH